MNQSQETGRRVCNFRDLDYNYTVCRLSFLDISWCGAVCLVISWHDVIIEECVCSLQQRVSDTEVATSEVDVMTRQRAMTDCTVLWRQTASSITLCWPRCRQCRNASREGRCTPPTRDGSRGQRSGGHVVKWALTVVVCVSSTDLSTAVGRFLRSTIRYDHFSALVAIQSYYCRQGSYVFASVCLSLCLSVSRLTG